MLFHFSGSLKDEFTNHQGYIEVTNLSEENDPEDLDVSCNFLLFISMLYLGDIEIEISLQSLCVNSNYRLHSRTLS